MHMCRCECVRVCVCERERARKTHTHTRTHRHTKTEKTYMASLRQIVLCNQLHVEILAQNAEVQVLVLLGLLERRFLGLNAIQRLCAIFDKNKIDAHEKKKKARFVFKKEKKNNEKG